MSHQQSRAEYQTPPTEVDQRDRERLEQEQARLRDEQAVREAKILLERHREVTFLRAHMAELEERQADQYKRSRVLRHVNRAEGMLDAGGDCEQVMREILGALEVLADR
jgi:hypothetical protein